MESNAGKQNQIFNNYNKKKSFKNIKTLHKIISIVIISSWIFFAGIICYVIIYDFGTLGSNSKALIGIHWYIAIAVFIITLAISFFLQTILIEIENKNDLRSKIIHELNREHRNYSKEKRNHELINLHGHTSKNTNEIIDDEDEVAKIIKYFGNKNNFILYKLYRQIQNLLRRSKEKQQTQSDDFGEFSLITDLKLKDDEVHLNVVKELAEFQIPDGILEYFIHLKMKQEGLTLDSYILPVSFFLFIYFSGFLIIAPLINSIFYDNIDRENIDIFSIFSNQKKDSSVQTGIPILVIQWGFLGGLVYTSISLLNRFLRKDLPPRVYYNASFRLLLSGAASVIVFLLYNSIYFNNNANELRMTSFVLLVCFSLGIAPIQFLIRSSDIVLSKFMKFWRHRDTAGKRSLINIEGIDAITAERLSEEGLDYIQQLALSDPVDLSFKTKYPMTVIKDWKDQAMLYLLTADILVSEKDNTKSQNKQYLYYVLIDAYGIKRFSQLYHLTHTFFKMDIHNENKINKNYVENSLQDFSKGLGLIETDENKFKYIMETITKTGLSLSELHFKYERDQFIQD
jgi:hypothetical protein